MQKDSSQRVRAILAFIQAADRGSFAAAARALNISSAAVSKNIAGLEQSLGARLMNRSTRSLQLTTEGQIFIERARNAIDALDEAIGAVTAQRSEATGSVRISTSNAFGLQYLLPLVSELQQRHPGLTLEIDFDDHRIDLIRDGYDLALRGGKTEDSSVIARPICTLYTILVASPAYLAEHGIPDSPSALTSHKLIAVRFLSGQVSRWGFNQANGIAHEIDPPSPSLTVSAPDAAVNAAVLGLGIAQTGVHHAWKHMQEGRLKLLLNKYHHSSKREMSLQYPHRALLAPRIRVTVDFLLEKFAMNEALHVTPETLKPYIAHK